MPEQVEGHTIKGFMCKVDFEHHIDSDVAGTLIYPDEETIRRKRKCIDECGMVEVEVKLVRVVQESNYPTYRGNKS